jgi:hypothetical protein
VENIEWICLSIDLWYSQNKIEFIGAVGHFILNNEGKEFLLNVKELDTQAKTEEVERFIKETKNHFNINDKLIGISTDGGSNVWNAFKNQSPVVIWCFNHIISLCIKDMVNKKPQLYNLVEKMKSINHHFINNKNSMKLLRFYQQNGQQKNPKTFCDTRWGSVIGLIDFVRNSFSEIYKTLGQRFKYEDTFTYDINFELTKSEIKLLDKLYFFLREINKISINLQSVQYSTVVDAYPKMMMIVKIIDKTEKEFIEDDEVIVEVFQNCSQSFEIDDNAGLIFTPFETWEQYHGFHKEVKKKERSTSQPLKISH